MAFMYLALTCLVAAANAGVLAPASYLQAAPLAVAKVAVAEPYDANPQYSYSYSVQDGLTGDSKSAEESRSGDSVQGSYSLVEPDGAIRTVRYNADPINGFNAVVERSGAAVVKQVVAQPIVKQVIAQPIVKQVIAQPQYLAAAPVVHHQQYIQAPQLIQRQVLQPQVQVIQQAPQLIQRHVLQPQVQVYQQQPQLIQKQLIQPQVQVYQQPQLIQPQVQVYQQPQLIQKQVLTAQPAIVSAQVVTNHAAYSW